MRFNKVTTLSGHTVEVDENGKPGEYTLDGTFHPFDEDDE